MIQLFFKSCTTTIDLIQGKLEYEKSNADNSAETKLYEKEDQLRQISTEHQVFFLQIAVKLFESDRDFNFIQIKQALELDLRIKLINEELVAMTEREAP